MRRVGLISIGTLAVAISVGAAYLARPRPELGLFVEQPVINLGVRDQGETTSATFKFANKSPETIRILDVLRNCDCVGAKLARDSLEPGESDSLDVEWETRTRRGDTSAEMTIVYVKPDGQPRYALVQLKAHVEPDFKVEPLSIGFHRGGGTQRLRVNFTPHRMSDLVLIQAYCTHRAFKAKHAPGDLHVDLEFDPTLWPEEGANIELMVETNSPHEPRFRSTPVVDPCSTVSIPRFQHP